MKADRFLVVLAAVLTLSLMASAATPTQTSLTVSSSSVPAGTPLLLTAAVTSGGVPVYPGTVVFCNAAAAHCEDFAILGSAQLTSAGVANLRIPVPANTSVNAVFQGTPHSTTPRASSTSPTVTVRGLSSTLTGPLVAAPDNGLFDLSTTVAGFGANPLTGTVTFQDSVQNGGPLTLGVDSITAVPAQQQFAAAISLPLPLAFVQLAIADLNNDGLPDFLVVQNYSSFSPGEEDLLVVLSNGDGTYQTMTQYFPTIDLAKLAVGDFNNDGLPDIVVFDMSEHRVLTMLGDGHGHFTAGSPVVINLDTSVLLVADLNGDGNLDVMSVPTDNSGGEEVLLGSGDGHLAYTLPTAPGYTKFLKDLNGDGYPDVIRVNESTGTIDSYLGIGNGKFTYKWSSTPPVSAGYQIASADFNGDGIPDLLTTDHVGTPSTTTGQILLGNGDGTFTAGYAFQSASGSFANFGTGDFNGDGKPDVYFFSGASLQIALGNGDGTLQPPYVSSAQGSLEGQVDFNGDGLTDLLLYGTPSPQLYLSEFTKPAATSVALAPNLDHVITALYSGSALVAPSSATYDVITFPNVTSQLKLTSSAFLYSRPRQAYIGTITATNVSSSTIAGPLQLGFTGLPYTVMLLNPTVNKNQGFFTSPTSLAPGQSVSFAVEFSNPNNVAISYTLIAYTGAF